MFEHSAQVDDNLAFDLVRSQRRIPLVLGHHLFLNESANGTGMFYEG